MSSQGPAPVVGAPAVQPPGVVGTPVSGNPYMGGPGQYRGMRYGYYDESNKQYWVVGGDGKVYAANPAEVALIKAGQGQYSVGNEQQYAGSNGNYGVYDEQNQKYMVYAPDYSGGPPRWREATASEATLIYNNGGSATLPPTLAPNPAQTGMVVQGPATTDPSTQLPQLPADYRPEPTIQPGVGRLQRPQLDMAWRQNDQYNQIYGRRNTGWGQQGADYFPEAADPNGAQALAYQSDEGRGLAWAHFITREADPNSYYGRWLADQFKREESEYANYGILSGDKEQLWTDWVNRAAPGLANEFLQLPGWQQGKNATPWFAGRRM